MKIYTRKGDGGETSLIGGKRVKKSNVRIHAYGTVDELNSMVGLLRVSCEDEKVKEDLLAIQNQLFVIGSHLASAPGAKMQLPDILKEDVVHLENLMDKMNDDLPELRSFILPGGNEQVSYGHLCRTICRRAERWAIETADQESLDSIIVEYLNRLSDYFFVLCRKLSSDNNAEEIPWKPLRD